jgi:hypothetical protein
MTVLTLRIIASNTDSLSLSLPGFCAGVFGAAINTPGDTVRTVVQKRVLGGLPGTVCR